MSGRLQGGPTSNQPKAPGGSGPLPKTLKPEASEALRLAEARVLRVLEAVGGAFARVLRVLAAPGRSFVGILCVGRLRGGPASNEAKSPGGSPS